MVWCLVPASDDTRRRSWGDYMVPPRALECFSDGCMGELACYIVYADDVVIMAWALARYVCA